jgi:hypothetical protein
MSCSLVAVDRCYSGPYCLHGAVSQKALVFTLAAVRTWSLTIFVILTSFSASFFDVIVEKFPAFHGTRVSITVFIILSSANIKILFVFSWSWCWWSHRWSKTASLNCGRQQSYFSSPRWYMSVESHGGITTAGENSWFVYHSSLEILPEESSNSKARGTGRRK